VRVVGVAGTPSRDLTDSGCFVGSSSWTLVSVVRTTSWTRGLDLPRSGGEIGPVGIGLVSSSNVGA